MITQTITEAREKVRKLSGDIGQIEHALNLAEQAEQRALPAGTHLMAARNAAMLTELMAGGLWLDLEVAARKEGAL